MRRVILSAMSVSLLGACQPTDRAQNVSATEPPGGNTVAATTEAASPQPSPTLPTPQANAVDLSRFAGKYPFDKVDGVSFLDHPAVKAAVAASGLDKKDQEDVLNPSGPQSTIVLKDGRLIAWGCQAHNCGNHHWSTLIAPDGTNAEFCYLNAREGAEGANDQARWFKDGKAEAKSDDCPDGN